MPKRFYPQQQGDRKRARLDISVSDHNFPLSQKKAETNNWGDDNDDEILLLASQACEEVYNNDLSSLPLPDYNKFMQPGSSSTQINSNNPSTSKADFSFKKPTSYPTAIVSTNLKEKYNRIASPLRGITAQVTSKGNIPQNSADNAYNDNIYINDSDHIHRQLLQLQKENERLKGENGKLLEKCVTKEGEASILRTQLKTCQVAFDNACLEKIKIQEKVQMEWTDKLSVANNLMHDLRTQLDFKNLEIISIQEKCKLESTKVRLTQAPVANNDISPSHREGTNISHNESVTQKRVETKSNSVQTEDKTLFTTLIKPVRTEDSTKTTKLLSYILEQISSSTPILDNDKVQTDIPRKCKVYSTFQIDFTNKPWNTRKSAQISCFYEGIVQIVGESKDKEVFYKVFTAARQILSEVIRTQLVTIKRKMRPHFQKEMNKMYIEASSSFIDVSEEDLLKGGALYKYEHGILARRTIAILSRIQNIPCGSARSKKRNIVILCEKICQVLAKNTCGTIFSGLILSIMCNMRSHGSGARKNIRNIIQSRPMGFVSIKVLEFMTKMSSWESFEKNFCARKSAGNLKVDHDQGILLYKKESCCIQILLKHIEICLKHIESEQLVEKALDITRNLLIFHVNFSSRCPHGLVQDISRCKCQFVLIQVLVYALRICAHMLQDCRNETNDKKELLSLCRCGIQILNRRVTSDEEFCSLLAYDEGHYAEFCEIMRQFTHTKFHANMLSELSSTIQSTPEDMPPSPNKQPWLESFQRFSMND